MLFRSLVNFVNDIADLIIKGIGWLIVLVVAALAYQHWFVELSTFWKWVIGFLGFATLLGAAQSFIEHLKSPPKEDK